MAEVAVQVIDILKKNMREPPENLSLDTPLSELNIESIDLAVIVFDIEDTFGIEVPYNANEDLEEFSTVGAIVTKVQALMAQPRVAA